MSIYNSNFTFINTLNKCSNCTFINNNLYKTCYLCKNNLSDNNIIIIEKIHNICTICNMKNLIKDINCFNCNFTIFC